MVTHDTPPTPPCDCYRCEWDRERAARRRAGLDEWPNRPRYTSEMLLECPRFRRIGPAHCYGREERDWWAQHGPHAVTWMRELIHAELDDDLHRSRYGAWSLLSIPAQRAYGIVPGERAKPPFRWDGVDAYEVLVDGQVADGMRAPWTAAGVARDVVSLAAYLTRVGVIPPTTGEVLLLDLAERAPRWIDWIDGDGPRPRRG